MALPAYVPLNSYHGDSFAQSFRLLDEDAPLDLTGVTIDAWAQNGAGPIVLEVELGANPGEFSITASPGVLPAGLLSYDVQLTDAGEVQTWIRGSLRVDRDVTDP